MDNGKMIFPWGTSRRFNAYPDHLRGIFGSRVQKVSVNAGFTCPNRDGTVGYGGCAYCNNLAFVPSYCKETLPVKEQIEKGIGFHRRRYRRAHKYIAYFQSYTNTYSGVGSLKKLYSEALSVPGVVGLAIGTRPDCIDEGILDYLQELSGKYYIIVEYGFESCYDHTLERINRGHGFAASREAVIKTRERGIRTGAHIIFGLPGETEKDMIRQATILSELPLDTVKFRQLQIVKGTPMAREYFEDPSKFRLFRLEEYLDFMVSFIELLNPSFVVERIAGEVPPRYLAVPLRWGVRNETIVDMFEKKLKEAGTWQGKKYSNN